MSIEEDDDQSFYDAQSKADPFELAAERAWEVGAPSFDWPTRATSLTPAQLRSRPSIIHEQDSLDLEDGGSNEQEFDSGKILTEPKAVPTAITEHLVCRRNTLTQRHLADENTRCDLQTLLNSDISPALSRQRPSTSGGEYAVARSNGITMSTQPMYARQTRSKTFSSLYGQTDKNTAAKIHDGAEDYTINRAGPGRDDDLFLELANDQAAAEERTKSTSHGELTSTSISFPSKRRSLPAEDRLSVSAERRPKSSGYILGSKTTSRLRNSLDLPNRADTYRGTPSRLSTLPDDAASISSRSQSGAPQRYVAIPDRASSLTEQIQSPGLLSYGRRRPSFGASPRQGPRPGSSRLATQLQDSYSESPAEDSEPKRSLPDSASVDSETADTVWDELDDLKSRIKKLELTGKLPQTSGAAVSTDQHERPRTATTAPTTIDSSPKNEKAEKQDKKPEPAPASASSDAPVEYIVGGPDAANIHPNLHGALAKAKSLLNPSLYRSLEATAADALQLAAMTGSAGPQGTALTAAAIINGVTVSDRHVRRKADTMCRNLTDLVLALCEGKSDSSNIMSTPVTVYTPAKETPSLRYSRSSLSPNGDISRSTLRPMSRLEARRTSILGSQVGSHLGSSPVDSAEDFSASEQESAKSYPRIQEPKVFTRPLSRLQAARQRHFQQADEDEDPTIRPPSRAMTDIVRAKQTSREYNTPQGSPSLRESLAARRVNNAAHESNRELSRVASLTADSARRRTFDPSTPSVQEEEGYVDDYQSSSSQARRRITSYNAYGTRRTPSSLPNRSTSLYQSRQVAVE